MSLADAELLKRWRAGDQRAGHALVERKYAMIERFFLNKIAGGAEDLVQDTFLACVKNADRVENDRYFDTYLFSIAYNMLRQHLRKRYRQGHHIELEDECLVDLDPSPSQIIARGQQHRHLVEALRSIPIASQVLLELFYWENLSSDEIARILGIPSGTVRGRLGRARKALARVLNRLANRAEPLETTITKLDDWAEACRRQLPGIGA